MAASRLYRIEIRAHIEIVFKVGYSQKQIVKKLNISRNGVQYSLQWRKGRQKSSWSN